VLCQNLLYRDDYVASQISSRTKRLVKQGSDASWKVLDFFVKFPSPGKSWKLVWSWKALQILVQCPGKSWNFYRLWCGRWTQCRCKFVASFGHAK